MGVGDIGPASLWRFLYCVCAVVSRGTTLVSKQSSTTVIWTDLGFRPQDAQQEQITCIMGFNIKNEMLHPNVLYSINMGHNLSFLILTFIVHSGKNITLNKIKPVCKGCEIRGMNTGSVRFVHVEQHRPLVPPSPYR